MSQQTVYSVYGGKPTSPMIGHKYLRVNFTKQVVRCTAFAPATRQYDVETVEGNAMTLGQTEVSTDVTTDEELKFMAVNPER